MAELAHLGGVGVILRDQGCGRVQVKHDGEPVVRYKLAGRDLDHIRTGIDHATHLLEASGATRIYSSHQRGISYTPRKGSRSKFLAECDAAGYGPGQSAFVSLHLMGTARMGGSPDSSATDPDGTTWDVRNLVVADGSCFPTASGVNPMISIESIAYMNASRLAAALT
ncbi:MAG TPA: GMC family oxidoreductase [Mycobacterium sp.]